MSAWHKPIVHLRFYCASSWSIDVPDDKVYCGLPSPQLGQRVAVTDSYHAGRDRLHVGGLGRQGDGSGGDGGEGSPLPAWTEWAVGASSHAAAATLMFASTATYAGAICPGMRPPRSAGVFCWRRGSKCSAGVSASLVPSNSSRPTVAVGEGYSQQTVIAVARRCGCIGVVCYAAARTIQATTFPT
jgi:hypothetical protein